MYQQHKRKCDSDTLVFFFYKLGLSYVLLNRHLSEIISQGYTVYKIAGIIYGMVSVLKVPVSSLFVFFVFQFESKYHQMHFRGKFSFALRLDF